VPPASAASNGIFEGPARYLQPAGVNLLPADDGRPDRLLHLAPHLAPHLTPYPTPHLAPRLAPHAAIVRGSRRREAVARRISRRGGRGCYLAPVRRFAVVVLIIVHVEQLRGPYCRLPSFDRRIVITLELIVARTSALTRKRLLPGGMRANDLKELFCFMMPDWMLRSPQSVLARANRTPKVIATLGFSFARIRDTSCRS